MRDYRGMSQHRHGSMNETEKFLAFQNRAAVVCEKVVAE